ncbi:hypothetical protein ACS0TY_008362 [Phlomoides rotata]
MIRVYFVHILKNQVCLVISSWSILAKEKWLNLNLNLFFRPTFRRIIRNKDTEEFHPYTYIATTLNCLMWLMYGLAHPHNTLIITNNYLGGCTQIIYLVIFFVYTKKRQHKVLIPLIVMARVAFIAVISVITHLCFHTTSSR